MSPVKRTAMKLKQLRQARQLSQQALADKAGLSREYLARLEGARQDPTLGMLEKLAKALRVKVSALIE